MRPFCPKCYASADPKDEACLSCGRARPAGQWPLDTLLGTSIDGGKYEVEAMIGRGGFGTVYRVRHTLLEEQAYAMKVLPASATGSADAEQTFLAEVRVLMKVQHPNIVAPHDVGRLDNGSLFLRMELAEGDTVDRALRKGRRFPPQRIAEVGAALASALAAAHAQGIVHRDLKPDNVIIRSDGAPKLIDFGIAKLVEADEKVSRLIGSPLYMAPEQLRTGNAIDGRADVYQLGAVLHYMTTGRSPYPDLGTRDARAMLLEISRRQKARILDEGPRPSELVPRFAEVSPDLDRYIGRMLSSDPRRRPAALAAAEALSRLAGDAPTHTSSMMSPLTDELGDTMLVEPSTDSDTLWVAVAPFAVRDAQTDDHVAQELAEDIADTLSMSGRLRVRPYSVSVARSGGDVTPEALRAALEVDVVVEGSVSRSGETYRVRVRAVHVADGLQLWAGRFQGSISDVFTMTDDIAAAVAEALTDDSSGVRPRTHATELSPEAAELYVRARSELRLNWSDNLTRASELFDEALVLAPDHAQLLSCAANCSARRAFLDGGRQHIDRARALTARALDAAPQRHEPLYARALLHYVENRWADAMADVHAALRTAGSNASLHSLKGSILAETGPLPTAIQHLQTALNLDPTSISATVDCARALALAGRFDVAEAMLQARMDDAPRKGLIAFPLARLARWRDGDADIPNFEAEAPVDVFMSRAITMMNLARHTGTMPLELRLFLAQETQGSDNPRKQLLLQQLSVELTAMTGAYEDALITLTLADGNGLMDLMWLERCPLLTPLRSSEAYHAVAESVRARVQAVRERVR